MYCSQRNCYNDVWLVVDNDLGLCKEHFDKYNQTFVKKKDTEK